VERKKRKPVELRTAKGRTGALAALVPIVVLASLPFSLSAEEKDDPTSFHSTSLLFQAVRNGQVEKVASAIERGANVNAKGEFGDTPLIVASWRGKLDIVKLLLERGADVHATNDIGETALFWAVPRPEVAAALISAGSNVNARNDYLSTPLMYAAKLGYPDTVKILLESGADRNARNEYGETALLLAEAKGYTSRDEECPNQCIPRLAWCSGGRGECNHEGECSDILVKIAPPWPPTPCRKKCPYYTIYVIPHNNPQPDDGFYMMTPIDFSKCDDVVGILNR
jgi:hypothetical protein